jgi:hypothetical protein
MAKTKRNRRNRRRTRKRGGSGINHSINLTSPKRQKTFHLIQECDTSGRRTAPLPEFMDPEDNYLEPGTIILRLETHGSLITNRETNAQVDLNIPEGLEYLQTVTLGTPGCVNFSGTKNHIEIMEKIIPMFNEINNEELKEQFIEKCKGINDLYPERNPIVERKGKKIINSKYQYYKYETGNTRGRADKNFSYDGLCYPYRCITDEHCKGIFVINYKLPGGKKNKNVGSPSGDFPNHSLDLPPTEEYFKGNTFSITLSQLLKYLVDKGYTKIFIYDDSCNSLSGCTNSCNISDSERFHLGEGPS